MICNDMHDVRSPDAGSSKLCDRHRILAIIGSISASDGMLAHACMPGGTGGVHLGRSLADQHTAQIRFRPLGLWANHPGGPLPAAQHRQPLSGAILCAGALPLVPGTDLRRAGRAGSCGTVQVDLALRVAAVWLGQGLGQAPGRGLGGRVVGCQRRRSARATAAAGWARRLRAWGEAVGGVVAADRHQAWGPVAEAHKR